MRVSSLLLLALAALPAAACQVCKKDGAIGATSYGLQRPKLGDGWNWAGQALPTGDLRTSVLTLEKITPSTLCLEKEFEYTIRLKNISQTKLTDVVVSDSLPGSGYKFRGAEPAATRSGNTLSWDFGDVAPGATREMTVKGHVTDNMGQVPCCASVSYGPHEMPKVVPPAPKPVPPPAPKVEPPVLVAKLTLVKSTPPDTCLMDEIPIRLVVKNTGNGRATDVKVMDQLPDGWTVNGKPTLSFDVGALEPGASKELAASARASRVGRFTNNATASAAGGLTATATSDTNVHKAILEITKSADRRSTILGRPVTFTVTVKNTGDWVAGDCTIKDTVTGADSVSAISDGGTSNGASVMWKLGDLQPGASRSVKMTATRSSAGAIDNTATASAHCADPVSASASAAFAGIPAVLLEVKDNPDPVVIGATTTYTIVVTNQGTAADSDIVISCGFEDNVEFVSAEGATAGTRKGSTVTFAPLGSIKPKEVAQWTVVVKGVKAGDSRFKVALTTHETQRPIEETEATRIYE